jgi:DNA-directed RNA polymerase III subunit RPC3
LKDQSYLLPSSGSCGWAGWEPFGLVKSNIAQRIFTILLRRGRLPIQSLAQHTRLTRRQLQHGLVVLIQQNLIYYFEEDPQTIYYEANQDAAYGLVRSGKILDLVESRYGPLARDIAQNLFILGHTKVCDLADAYQRSRESLQNGDSNAAIESGAQLCSPAQLDSILYNLLEAGLVEPVTDIMFRSPDDTYNEVEKAILDSEFAGGTKGTKQKETLKSLIRDKLDLLRVESRNWKPKSNKRKLDGAPLNGTNGSAKRRKLSNGSLAVNGNHAHEHEGLGLDVGSTSFRSRMKLLANLHKAGSGYTYQL